jgi:hypothetical protein
LLFFEAGVILDKDIKNAEIAQLVEQRTENPRVAGSIPALGIFKAPQHTFYTSFSALLSDVNSDDSWPVRW